MHRSVDRLGYCLEFECLVPFVGERQHSTAARREGLSSVRVWSKISSTPGVAPYPTSYLNIVYFDSYYLHRCQH